MSVPVSWSSWNIPMKNGRFDSSDTVKEYTGGQFGIEVSNTVGIESVPCDVLYVMSSIYPVIYTFAFLQAVIVTW